MVEKRSSFLEQWRNEEYTGVNRCVPCTIVNLVIALGLSVLAALVAVEVAIVVLVISLVAIYLRGYLVPGTPSLTKRYLPDRVLQYFDHHPLDDEIDSEEFETVEKINRERRNAVDPETFLLEADVTTPTADGSDLRLTDAFADAVDAAIEAVDPDGPDPRAIADIFDTDPDSVEFKDREYPAIKIDRRIRKWPSEAALFVDVATHQALVEQTDQWTTVPVEQRVGILESLRTFQLQCPQCGGDVDFGDDVVESCCAKYEVITYGCLDCDARLLELEPAMIEEGDGSGIRA